MGAAGQGGLLCPAPLAKGGSGEEVDGLRFSDLLAKAAASSSVSCGCIARLDQPYPPNHALTLRYAPHLQKESERTDQAS